MSESVSWQHLATTLLGAMVGHPDAVKLHVREDRRGVLITAEVHPDDTGRVIGKGGANVAAIRTLVAFAGEQRGVVASFELKNA